MIGRRFLNVADHLAERGRGTRMNSGRSLAILFENDPGSRRGFKRPRATWHQRVFAHLWSRELKDNGVRQDAME